MAQIDPNIALGFKLPQIENPVNALGRAQEVSINAMKMQELQRGLQEEEQLRNYLASADLAKPETRAGLAKFGKSGLAYGKALAEQEKAGLESKQLKNKITEQDYNDFKRRTADLAFNPSDENVLAHLQDGILRGQTSQAAAQQQWAQISKMNPQQRKQYFTQMAVDVGKRYEMENLSEFQKQNLGIQRERLAADINPELQGRIAGAKTQAQEAAKRETAGNVDVTANRKALAQAGYDVATGKDEITDLIKKSTGSYLGKAVDISGRAIGKATEGSQALAALEQKANAITFGLLNGKLGAGISKSDAELVASLVGKLGDGTLPVEDRLAAWNSAKNMMMNLGMVAEPKGSAKPGATAKPSSSAPALPSGFTLDKP